MKRKKRRKAIADGERKDEMMDAIKWVRMPDEAVKDAFSIREEVFVKEQGFQEEFDSTDDSCWHLICYQNGCPTGLRPALHRRKRRVARREDRRPQGLPGNWYWRRDYGGSGRKSPGVRQPKNRSKRPMPGGRLLHKAGISKNRKRVSG